ncbi:MAG: sugar ABC transporter substrate-binding protein [Solirubrobacteraceae bacterium]|jgi:simple sugar transport system substrate-binding protein
MSDIHDVAGEALERLEWLDSKKPETPQTKARAVTRRTALTAGAGALAGLTLGSPVSAFASSTARAASGASIFGVTTTYKFTMVNHVTTNPFFTPTQYGASDACSLLGCSYQWTGSASSNVPQMVSAFNTAIAAGVDGIACAMIDPNAFTGPTKNALGKGIPVLSYNADEPNGRLAYIGQDLFVSGQQMGAHIRTLVPSGTVALFIATPGSANIQPRIDGAESVLKGTSTKYTVTATGAAVPQELTTIEAFWPGHKTYKGIFAVDGGSTQSCFQTIKKYGLKGKVACGGYDLTPITEELLAAGYGQFTIDQQPYLQGFLPILELFLYKASGGLSGIADVDTGLKFLNPTTVVPYSSTKSRYEGTGSAPGVAKA